jgi:hypothetical protein
MSVSKKKNRRRSSRYRGFVEKPLEALQEAGKDCGKKAGNLSHSVHIIHRDAVEKVYSVNNCG